MSRTGKIARLPRPLQDELNQRLEKNIPGREILAWLNSHPDARSVFRDYFDGTPVSEQNLSNWRAGGFAEWQYRQGFLDELRAFSVDVAQLESALSPMAGHASRLLSLHYALTMARGETGAGLDMKRIEALKPLYAMTRAVAVLRTLEQRDALIRLKQQQLPRACSGPRSRDLPAPAPALEETPPASPSEPAGKKNARSLPRRTALPATAGTTPSKPPGALATSACLSQIRSLPSTPPAARVPVPVPAPARVAASAGSAVPAPYNLAGMPASPAATPAPIPAPLPPWLSNPVKVNQGAGLKLTFDDPDPVPLAVTGFAGSRGYQR